MNSVFEKLEQSTTFKFKQTKCFGYKQKTFKGKTTSGYRLTIQLNKENVEKVLLAWEKFNPTKETPLFGDFENILSINLKKGELSEKNLKELKGKCHVDIKIVVSTVFVNKNQERFPQLQIKFLKKVESPPEEEVEEVEDTGEMSDDDE